MLTTGLTDTIAKGFAPPTALLPDVRTLGAELAARALTDPAGAAGEYRASFARLSPFDQGELARLAPAVASLAALDFDIPGIPGLPNLPGLPRLPSLPDIDLPSPGDLLRFGGQQAREALQRGAERIKEVLATVPHEVADTLANSMRGPNARVLTDAEKQVAREVFGGRIDLDKVRFVDGPGRSPIAAAAFLKGNPAIAIGDTVYWAPGKYSADFAADSEARNKLIHELTHVMQYEDMGYARFGAQYASDLKRVGGDPDKLYDFETRNTTYSTETLEGQAEMAGDYAEIRGSTDPADHADIKGLEYRLRGTGIYGL